MNRVTKAEKQKLKIKGGMVAKCFCLGENFCFLAMVIIAPAIVISLPIFIKHRTFSWIKSFSVPWVSSSQDQRNCLNPDTAT